MMATVTDSEHALIAATLGFTTIEVLKMWQDSAPSLEDMRSAPDGDPAMRQRMLDANYLGAGLSLMIGGTVAWLSKSWIPLILSLGTLSFMAYWYKLVLRSDHTIMGGFFDERGNRDHAA